MKGDIRLLLDYLNETRQRATYAAVQSYLGFGVLEKPDWDDILGPRRPYTSWVVSKKTGLPIGFEKEQLHPDLLKNPKIIGKGRQLQAAVRKYAEQQTGKTPGEPPGEGDGRKKGGVEVVDCHGNNCAVVCPRCSRPFVVSGFLNKGVRACPHCGQSRAVFKEVKAEWEASHREAAIEPEQRATRLVFKTEWLGYDVWVTFTEDGVTYRYPHDQLLQAFINRLGIIENTKSWQTNGIYSFPRLSAEQKRMLERYIVERAPEPGDAPADDPAVPELDDLDPDETHII